jgi:hypothetical protein
MASARYTKNGPSSNKKSKNIAGHDPSDTDVRAMTGVPAGDYYGTGVKNPMGKLRSTSLGPNPTSPKQLKKPPKSLA